MKLEVWTELRLYNTNNTGIYYKLVNVNGIQYLCQNILEMKHAQIISVA